MTIKNIVNAMNSHPEIWVTVYNVYADMMLYRGHYDRMTETMLQWEVELFSVEEMVYSHGNKQVSRVTIWLEYGAEFR